MIFGLKLTRVPTPSFHVHLSWKDITIRGVAISHKEWLQFVTSFLWELAPNLRAHKPATPNPRKITTNPCQIDLNSPKFNTQNPSNSLQRTKKWRLKPKKPIEILKRTLRNSQNPNRHAIYPKAPKNKGFTHWTQAVWTLLEFYVFRPNI